MASKTTLPRGGSAIEAAKKILLLWLLAHYVIASVLCSLGVMFPSIKKTVDGGPQSSRNGCLSRQEA